MAKSGATPCQTAGVLLFLCFGLHKRLLDCYNPHMFIPYVLAMLCAGIAFASTDWTEPLKSGELFNKSKAETDKLYLTRLTTYSVDDHTIRLAAGAVTIGELKFGEVLVYRNAEGGISSLRIMVYNKGDDGFIDKATFEQKVDAAVSALDELTGVKGKAGRVSARDAGLKGKSVEWIYENGVIIMEHASENGQKKSEFEPEFIRLMIGPDAESINRGGASDITKRSKLRANVQKEDDGTVWIGNMPMVDQGQKGYCVPATLARVFAYYGMDGVDQHALAALCKSKSAGKSGTSLDDMEEAMNAICHKFHVKIQTIEDYAALVRALREPYDKYAKKADKPPLARKKPFRSVDASVLRQARAGKKSDVDKWLATIRKYIDAGIPVLWSVQLGLYEEQGTIPQSHGAHMRMIMGYNLEKRTIIYSDSWGARHAKKEIDAADAMSMTTSSYVLRLTR